MNAAREQLDVAGFDLPPAFAYEADAGPPARPRVAAQGRTGTVDPFPITRLDDIQSKPSQGIVQGLGLDREAMAAIVGSPNAGKTAFAVSLAVHLAVRAERWLGRKISGGPVVYFASEAPGSVVMRAHAAARQMEATVQPVYVSRSVPGLGGQSSAAWDADRVIATVRAVERIAGESVIAVFVDTLAACLADGDENGEGMLRLAAGAKRIAGETGACVVLIHHPSKGDSAGLRGHGSLAAACDCIIRIDADDRTGVRTATLIKARDCATGLLLRFELEPVVLEGHDSFGDPRTTIVVRPSQQAVPTPLPAGLRQRELLSELERRHRIGERAWDEATARKAGRTLGMEHNSARDALRGLVKAGYLTGGPGSYILKFPPESVP